MLDKNIDLVALKFNRGYERLCKFYSCIKSACVMEINVRYSVTVDTLSRPNLRYRMNVGGIGLASGLHTVRVFGYGEGSNFFKSSCVTVNLAIT